MNKQKGFTLIELLIVIAIIAALSALAFVALNPVARFQDSRNAQRWADINMIMSAIKLHQVDNGGIYLDAIATDMTNDLYYQIGAGDACNDTCVSGENSITLQTNCVDLEGLIDAAYMPEWPIDPNAEDASSDETRYYLVKDSYGRIITGACAAELGSNESLPAIEITR
ncbi:MAG: prepilin-type N-terminal cleavage/methylation domain-containing protein [Candidatus Falkowbacteria bacterium]